MSAGSILVECTCRPEYGVDLPGRPMMYDGIQRCKRCLKRDAVFEPDGLWDRMLRQLQEIQELDSIGGVPSDRRIEEIRTLIAECKEVT